MHGDRDREDEAVWTNPLTIALVAVGSSLLTIFLTPWLQRQFWRKQRRDELRLAAINEFNRLTSEFLTGFLDAPETYKPTFEWFAAYNVVGGNIYALFFSRRPAEACSKVGVMIGPGPGPEGKQTADDFVKARNAALRALYQEVIPLTNMHARARRPRRTESEIAALKTRASDGP
jgi:hypothetical protein